MGSMVGVMKAPMMNATTIQWRRHLAKPLAETIPSFASRNITKGVSNTTPIQNSSLTTMLTELEMRICGVARSVPHPMRKSIALGIRM